MLVVLFCKGGYTLIGYTNTSKARLTFVRGNKSQLGLQKLVLNWNEKRSKKGVKAHKYTKLL